MVWVFRIPLESKSVDSTLDIPAGARFLTCADQHDEIATWWEIPDVTAPTEPRRIQLFGTGTGPIGDHLTYLGTTLHTGGSLVLHLYQVTGEPKP